MDLYRIRKLKEKFAIIHDFYEEHQYLLDDLTTRCLYRSLLSVNTREKLEGWLTAVGKTYAIGRLHHPLESPYDEDVLGAFAQLIRKLDEDEKELVVLEFNQLKADGFKFEFREEVELLEEDAERFHGIHPDRTLVMEDRYGERIAIGTDAERLFEVFGWQTATIALQERMETAVLIHEACIPCLEKYGVTFIKTKATIGKIHFLNEQEENIARAQQVIDGYRARLGKKPLVLPTDGMVCHMVVDGVVEEALFPFVYLSRKNVELYRINGAAFTLVDGQCWNVNIENDSIMTDSALIMESIMNRENLLEIVNEQALHAFQEYVAKKDMYPDKIVMMKGTDIMSSFGEDAVRLAKALGIVLWFRVVEGHQVPMVLVTERMADDLSADLKRLDIHVAQSSQLDIIGLISAYPSFLNEGLSIEIPFGDATVYKRKDGRYAVRASLDKRMLPAMTIPTAMARFFLELQDGIVKEACLKAILMCAYYHRDVHYKDLIEYADGL